MKRRLGVVLAICALAVVGSMAGATPAMAQVPDDRCGGWGLQFAELEATKHNTELRNAEPNVDTRRRAFQSRLTQFGRLQRTKEVCSRLDLERDLYTLWRTAGFVTVGLLTVTVAWGGLVWMLEGIGVSQQGRARMLIVNCFIGVIVVASAYVVWQGMYSGTFGFFTLELGEFNPIGAPVRLD